MHFSLLKMQKNLPNNKLPGFGYSIKGNKYPVLWKNKINSLSLQSVKNINVSIMFSECFFKFQNISFIRSNW